jgi:hypothetical protein
MKEGRFSTIRFNEWICISAQYEKAVARIGKQVYQGYSKGLVTDFTSIELCKEIGELFVEARELREELEEELERDALDGLNAEEAAKADEIRELTSAQKTKRAFKLKLTKFMGRHSVNRSLANHRDKVKELSRELGQRALLCFPEEPVLKVRGHKSLCRLANKLTEDADGKWTEITEDNKKGGGLSFHTILFGMIADFARFSKGTQVGKMLLKYFKYNEEEENQKLSQQYAGTNTAEALKAQLAEVDEPMLDVGREIDNMQQEYQESPEEWAMSGDGGEAWGEATQDEAWQSTTTEEEWGTTSSAPPPAKPKQEPSFSPDSDSGNTWGVEADEWVPEETVDDDFLNAVADAPEPPAKPEPTPPPPAPARATLVRKHHEPEAESWQEPSKPANIPQISSSPGASIGTEPPAASGSEDPDDWGWGSEDTSSSSSDSFSGQSMQSSGSTLSDGDSDPFKDALAAESAENPPPAPPAPEPHTEFKSKPTSKKPPFVKSKKEEPLGEWGQENKKPTPPKPAQTASSWGSAPETSTDSWASPTPQSTGNKEDDYGWGAAPAAAKKPEPEQPAHDEPFDPTLDTMSIDVTKLAEQLRTTQGADDPLVRLLEQNKKKESSGDSGDLGDDLLPDFLKDRKDDDPAEDSTFIPELPSFLESKDAPNLEIVPFGTANDNDGEEDAAPFIPEMPE